MSDSFDPRATQQVSRSQMPKQRQPSGSIPIAKGVDLSSQVMRMIENGEEPRKIFAWIAEAAASIEGITAAAIILPSDRPDQHQDVVAQAGDPNFTPVVNEETDRARRLLLQSTLGSLPKATTGDYSYFDIICLGAPIGSLVVEAANGLDKKSLDTIHALAHHSGVVFERQKLSSTLQHFVDRLEVLNELNQLIASNVGLQRIVKSLARESAFRFAADIALTFILDEDQHILRVKGGYGCTPNVIPKEFSHTGGLLGRIMQLGGHLSIINLSNHSDHGFDFLEELGIKSIDICCLEVRGETLGALLIGYRRELELSQNDLTRFEEFCQGAAVAIANARTQEQITAYMERLQELVEQRTADLAIQTARAEEANQAKSQFLANMSHELRTPLTAIIGYSSVLVDGVFGSLNEKQSDALTAIARSSQHLKNLIDDVLNLARIESGKEDPEPARVSVKELLTSTHKLMLQTSIGKGVALQPLKVPAEIEDIGLYVDPKHIHQILINLMSNAVKYTPKGGKVWVEVEKVVDKVQIKISDTGVGIPPDKLQKLFERFERGEDSYSKGQEGTGIGLNLTRRLVEANGGRIGVDSTVGQGSSFWILMPVATNEADSASKVQEETDVNIRLDGLSMLVVDDSIDTCEVLKHILTAAGGAVTTVNSVADARQQLAQATPDVLLTDLAIPGESGVALIEHLRGLEAEKASIPVIVLSACAFPQDRDAAMEAGANVFIAKPFRPTEVVKTVRQLALNMALQVQG